MWHTLLQIGVFMALLLYLGLALFSIGLWIWKTWAPQKPVPAKLKLER